MLYREFGKTGKYLSAVGAGTNRLAVANLQDDAGLERAADILCQAVESGVNYIDCARTYAMGKAEKIVGLTMKKLKRMGLSCYTCAKVMYIEDKTAGQARASLERALAATELDRVTFGYCWKICSYEEFLKVIEPGGVYEGLLRAKEEGLLEHICVTSHATAADTLKILQSGMFDGCIISCNVLNVMAYKELFDFVRQAGIGIFTMNSLAGGIIPQLENIGSLFPANGLTPAQNALRQLYREPAVTCMLSSMETAEQVQENTAPFMVEAAAGEMPAGSKAFLEGSEDLHYCTRCRYCSGCPAGIPIADMMYAYSSRFFTQMMKGYGQIRKDTDPPESEKAITAQIFNSRFCEYDAIPRTVENPCIHCGRCERLCTQKLPIISRVDEMYARARKASYSHEARKGRLAARLHGRGFQRVGFFPAGHYTEYLIEAYLEYFGKFPFELYVFDNDPAMWGRRIGNAAVIHPPKDIGTLRPDYILISNYKFSDEIYQTLAQNEDVLRYHIPVEKLHEEDDISWY